MSSSRRRNGEKAEDFRETRGARTSCPRSAVRGVLRPPWPAGFSRISLPPPAFSPSRAGASVRSSLRPPARVMLAVLLLGCVLPLFSCAYYNTYYLARKYYDKGTGELPYAVEKPTPGASQHFNKAIEYSKKVLAQYPKDKWVDDAYLMWARALLGTDDPRQAIKLLEDFSVRFPKSSLQNDAIFYLGVAYRQSRKYKDALRSLDEFSARAPHHKLAPYAYLERSRTLMALERPEEAAAAADGLLQRFPKSPLRNRAHVARAEARFAQKAFDLAREDFREMGSRSRSDAERFEMLLREADCLEGARKYDEELSLLGAALVHERAPAPADTASGRTVVTDGTSSSQNYGRLMLRIGTARLLAGKLDPALEAYRGVTRDFRRTELAAEAQYRIGYAYETAADDFEKARAEYARVKENGGASGYVTQANQRLTNLDRLAQFRSAGGDSVQKKSEAGFLLAELYLFQLEKPERALEEYRKIADEFTGTPISAKAMNAQAWVLSRKLKRSPEADSLFWAVVRQYPATEAQIAARDYLEFEGISVPSDLIKMPEVQLARADTLPLVTPPPMQTPLIYAQPGGMASAVDTTARLGPRLPPPLPPPPALLATPALPPPPAGGPVRSGDDFPRQIPPAAARRDSTAEATPARPDSAATQVRTPPSSPPPDTTEAPR